MERYYDLVIIGPGPPGMSAAISGMAGIGHILLGVSLVLLLVQLKRAVQEIR